MIDRRPELSGKLQRLSEGPQWFTWLGTRLRLEAVPDAEPFYPEPRRAIIVHRGRFGLAMIVAKDGLRALDVEWLTHERPTAQVYLRRHQIRALAFDAGAALYAEVDTAKFVGKPVRDGDDGPEIGRIIEAKHADGRVEATVELAREPAVRLPRLPMTNATIMLALLATSLGVDDGGYDQ